MSASIAYITVEVLIAALAILGNVLVCWAVSINTNLKTATNYFLVSLAMADIAVGLFAIPFAIVISIGFVINFEGCLFLSSFILVQTQSSIFSLLAVAIDRYLAVKVHLRYKGLVTGQRAKVIIAILWLLSFVIGLIPLLGPKHCLNGTDDDNNSSSNNNNNSGSSCLVNCLFLNVITLRYMVYFNFFGCVLPPLLLMLAIYMKIFTVVREQLRLIKHTSVDTDSSRTYLQKQLKAAKSLSIIVGFFAFCWLPLHVLNCINLLQHEYFRAMPSEIMNVAILLSHAHSVGNPIIYASRIQEFRNTFRQILTKHLPGRRPEWAGRERNGTADTQHSYVQAGSLLT